jgi:hypothetical protein
VISGGGSAAEASQAFTAVRTAGSVVQGGAMSLLGGGDFEDGALGALGSALGQGIGGGVSEGLSDILPADVSQFVGGVAGAGVGAVFVDARGGNGELAFLNGVVNTTVNAFMPPVDFSTATDEGAGSGVDWANAPDQSDAETNRLNNAPVIDSASADDAPATGSTETTPPQRAVSTPQEPSANETPGQPVVGNAAGASGSVTRYDSLGSRGTLAFDNPEVPLGWPKGASSGGPLPPEIKPLAVEVFAPTYDAINGATEGYARYHYVNGYLDRVGAGGTFTEQSLDTSTALSPGAVDAMQARLDYLRAAGTTDTPEFVGLSDYLDRRSVVPVIRTELVGGGSRFDVGSNSVLVRDSAGNLQVMSPEEATRSGANVIAGPGASITFAEGPSASLVLSAQASPALRQAATSFTRLVAAAMRTSLAGEASVLAGESFTAWMARVGTRALALVPEVSLRSVLGVAGGALLFANETGGPARETFLGENLRLVTPGEVVRGALQVRVPGLFGDRWVNVAGVPSLNEGEARQLLGGLSRDALSPEEIARLTRQPGFGTGQPMPPPPPLILVPPPPSDPLPGFDATQPTGPTVMVNPVPPQPTIDDIIITAVNGVDDPARGYPVRDDLDNHLINVDGRNGNVASGGHNKDSFIAWVTQQGGTYEIRLTGTSGVYEVVAAIPRGDDPTQMRMLEPKTVYDPAVYSDSQMNGMARDAGKQAWEAFQQGNVQVNPTTGRGSVDVTQNGVRFRVYFDRDALTSRPVIGNVHPIGTSKP